MACGAAVLASNTSSLPEVIGNRDALFDPNDDADLAQKIERALIDSKFRDSLKEHGIQQAHKFSWENSAKSLLALFEDIVKNNRAIQSAINETHDSIQNIISHVASLSSSLSFKDKDLIALSASIAESFCTRIDRQRRLFLDVSSIIKLDYLTGIQRVVLAICNELINNPHEIHIELVYTKTDDLEFYRADAFINKISGGKRDVH